MASANLASTRKAIARALERLSTGKRVNSPSDGAADYRLSLSLDSQIRGISQINLGINRALGMVQVADSAVASQMDILQRMREIAVEGASGTLDSATRKTLNSELQSLLEEFDRITKSTEFDGQKLLDGAIGNSSLLLDESGSSVSLEMPDLTVNETFEKTIGTGTFEDRITLTGGQVGLLSDSIKSEDIDGDGHLDLVSVATDKMGVRLGNGDGSFSALQCYDLSSALAVSVGLDDLDGDGILDAYIQDRNSGTASVLYGNGDGSFQAETTFEVDYATGLNFHLKAADIDEDGDLDLLGTGNSTYTISVLLNNGDGSFEAYSTIGGFSEQTFAINFADVNNDGHLDIISGDNSAGTEYLHVLLGNGDGTFEAPTCMAVSTTSPRSVELADLNNDGNLDILSPNFTGTRIYILLGNGDGTFQAFNPDVNGDATHYSVSTGDVNGDGVLDIITESRNNDSVEVHLGNGDGTFEAPVTYQVGDSPNLARVADFNEDGVLDIFTADNNDETISILFGKSQRVSAVADINVDSSEEASELIGIVDSTIEKLADYRGELGVIHSRLETSSAANLLQQESLTSAKSLVEDADFALETAELVKQQILQQAAVAVQAQANVQLQVVLGLLQFT